MRKSYPRTHTKRHETNHTNIVRVCFLVYACLARGLKLLNCMLICVHRETAIITMAVSRLMLKVGARGFEPPASRSQTVRSTRLSYAPL